MLHRFRFDDLPSGEIVNVKGKVIGKMRDRALAIMRDTKKSSERAYATQHTGPR
jgi:hypothetical protein